MLKRLLKNQLLRSSLFSIIARFVGVFLNFAVAILIAQKLPLAESGMFFLLMTYITGFSLFSRIGLDQLLMKEVASSHQDNQAFRGGFLRSSYKFVFLLSIIFIAIWLVLAPIIREYSFDGQIQLNYLLFAGIGILFFNFIIINSAYLKAIQKTISGVLSQNALPAISIIIMLGLFWNSFAEDQLYINLYTASLVLGGLVAIFLTFSHFSTKNISLDDKNSSPAPRFSELFKKSLPLAPVAFFSFLMIFADTIMVSFFLRNEDVSLYSIAGRISFIVLFFLGALEAVIYPRLLNFYKHNPHILRSFFWQSTALVIVIVLSVTSVMYFLSDWLLYVFGEEYIKVKQTLGLLLIAQFLRAASITFSFMFIIREKVRYLNIILVVSLIVNLVANVFFIKMYGIEGAALATLLSNGVLLLLVLALFVSNKLLTIPTTTEKNDNASDDSNDKNREQIA